jgi:hypothetical protein
VTRADQKESELRSVLALRAVYPDFPTGKVESSDDPLDVVVVLPDEKCIGIEVTEFIRDRSKRGSKFNAYQRLTAAIVENSEALYRELEGPPIFASLNFDYPISCGTNEVGLWAQRITRAVARVARSAGVPAELNAWNSDLPNGIRSITVYPIGGTREGQFAAMYTGPYGSLTTDQIEQILSRKEKQLEAYRQKCDEVWLLILVHGTRMSGWAQLTLEAESHAYATPFDRVLLFVDFTRVIQLRTA